MTCTNFSKSIDGQLVFISLCPEYRKIRRKNNSYASQAIHLVEQPCRRSNQTECMYANSFTES